eukprot:Seg1018.18 transcript_id=Seg1018.18/GoldUCD/mRNA.D3Y31 product="Unconventional myosin-Va" protein_id=Seg1018.18/GoldUCD/D3Y31
MAASKDADIEITKNMESALKDVTDHEHYTEENDDLMYSDSQESPNGDHESDEEDSGGNISSMEHTEERENAKPNRTKHVQQSNKGQPSTHKHSKGLQSTHSRKSRKRKAKMSPKSGKTKKKARREYYSFSASSSTSGSDSTSDSSDDNSSSSEEGDKTWQMTKSQDVNAWKLPKKLAKIFHKNLREHFTDEEIKTNILEDYPVAKNVPQAPSLDSIMETYLGSTKATYAAANDRSLLRMMSKVRDITGPLGHLLKLCHKSKQSTLRTKFIRKKMDQTMILVTQAMSALTFHRRRAVLTSLARNKERAHRWVKEKYHAQLSASKSELFGKSFFKVVQQDAKSVDLSVIQYLQDNTKKSKPPFRGGSATRPRSQACSNFAEPQRAATTSSRGARGKTPAQFPGLLEYESIPGVLSSKPFGRGPKSRGKSTSRETEDIITVKDITNKLSAILAVLNAHCVDMVLIKQIFTQINYFVCAMMLNNLLLRKDMCHWSRGMQISVCATLNPLQVCELMFLKVVQKILTMYTPANEYEPRVPSKVIRAVVAKATKQNPDPSTLMMNIQFSSPVNFPFTPSVVQFEKIQIPDSLKVPNVRVI